MKIFLSVSREKNAEGVIEYRRGVNPLHQRLTPLLVIYHLYKVLFLSDSNDIFTKKT